MSTAGSRPPRPLPRGADVAIVFATQWTTEAQDVPTLLALPMARTR
jgi:hypothetical protein